MPITARQILTSLAVVVVIAACAAPAATAGRFGPGSPSRPATVRAVHTPPTTCHQYCGSVDHHATPPSITVPPRVVTVTTNDGFSWADAAVGFGVACGLALLAGGLILIRRHGRVPEAV